MLRAVLDCGGKYHGGHGRRLTVDGVLVPSLQTDSLPMIKEKRSEKSQINEGSTNNQKPTNQNQQVPIPHGTINTTPKGSFLPGNIGGWLIKPYVDGAIVKTARFRCSSFSRSRLRPFGQLSDEFVTPKRLQGLAFYIQTRRHIRARDGFQQVRTLLADGLNPLTVLIQRLLREGRQR